jgi:hypothetical protein
MAHPGGFASSERADEQPKPTTALDRPAYSRNDRERGAQHADVPGSANDFGVTLRSDGRIVAGVGTPDVSVVSSSSGHNDGAWHHVVFTRVRASGAMPLYVDGVPAGTATGSTASLTSPTSIVLGRLAGGWNSFAGALDEVAFYNTALPAPTIAAHRAAGG